MLGTSAVHVLASTQKSTLAVLEWAVSDLTKYCCHGIELS